MPQVAIAIMLADGIGILTKRPPCVQMLFPRSPIHGKSVLNTKYITGRPPITDGRR